VEKQPVISQEDFYQQYEQRKPQYERLAINMQQAIMAFLTTKDIPYLEVSARVKSADSAYEKIVKKAYERPFEQIEDWCGIRITCYYPNDIGIIQNIISEEFEIKTSGNPKNSSDYYALGYRPTHFVIGIKQSWSATPNYLGLEKLKAEIQVRTVLMQAWAEVEHRLSYRSMQEIPSQFRRKFARLSAQFELADEQFEELRNGLNEYRIAISEEARDAPDFRAQKFNLDSLQAFLDVIFPQRESSLTALSKLFSEFKSAGMGMGDIIDGYELAKNTLTLFEVESADKSGILTQIGALRAVLDIGSDKYYRMRYITQPINFPGSRIALVNSTRKSLGKFVAGE
jgi:ppGpp synthetase/RelA/SpoT-type nucleotidyltranferase